MTRHRNRHTTDHDAWLERRSWATCQPCGKRSFETRRTARIAARETGRGKERHIGVYRCPHSERRVFHIGHTPTTIVRGIESRAEYLDRQQGRTA